MNSITSFDSLSTVGDTIGAVDREPRLLSHELASRPQLHNGRQHTLAAGPQSDAAAVARTRSEISSLRAEMGTLWVRPWGGK